MADLLPLATPADRIVARMSRSELIAEVHAQEQDLIAADEERQQIVETLWPGDPPADDITAGQIVIAIRKVQQFAERLLAENARLRAEREARRA